jgi:hypothetical protein
MEDEVPVTTPCTASTRASKSCGKLCGSARGCGTATLVSSRQNLFKKRTKSSERLLRAECGRPNNGTQLRSREA